MQLLNSKETQFWSPFLKVVLQGIRSKFKKLDTFHGSTVSSSFKFVVGYAQRHLAIKVFFLGSRGPKSSFVRSSTLRSKVGNEFHGRKKSPLNHWKKLLPLKSDTTAQIEMKIVLPNPFHPFHPKPGDSEQSRIFSITSVTLAAPLCLEIKECSISLWVASANKRD